MNQLAYWLPSPCKHLDFSFSSVQNHSTLFHMSQNFQNVADISLASPLKFCLVLFGLCALLSFQQQQEGVEAHSLSFLLSFLIMFSQQFLKDMVSLYVCKRYIVLILYTHSHVHIHVSLRPSTTSFFQPSSVVFPLSLHGWSFPHCDVHHMALFFFSQLHHLHSWTFCKGISKLGLRSIRPIE